MNPNWKELGLSGDSRSDAEVIRDRVEMLGGIFGRKVTEPLIAVFQDVLRGYPVAVLKNSFTKAESQCERMPTPKMMRAICNEEMPSQSWKYQYRPTVDRDGIKCWIDPDPPNKHEELLYRAEDCPEGREFLAKLGRSQRITKTSHSKLILKLFRGNPHIYSTTNRK